MKEEAKLSLPGHQLFLQSGACRMFPRGRLWEAELRLKPPAPQIMTIPVLIRVLWLMFDEEGDRLSGCFQHFFLLVFPAPYLQKVVLLLFFFSWKIGQSSALDISPSYILAVAWLKVVFHVSSSESCLWNQSSES